MLNPPLSNVPHEIIAKIVDDIVAIEWPFCVDELFALSRADRAFTSLCQQYFFRCLWLSGDSVKIKKRVQDLERLFQTNPSLAFHFRSLVMDAGKHHLPTS